MCDSPDYFILESSNSSSATADSSTVPCAVTKVIEATKASAARLKVNEEPGSVNGQASTALVQAAHPDASSHHSYCAHATDPSLGSRVPVETLTTNANAIADYAPSLAMSSSRLNVDAIDGAEGVSNSNTCASECQSVTCNDSTNCSSHVIERSKVTAAVDPCMPTAVTASKCNYCSSQADCDCSIANASSEPARATDRLNKPTEQVTGSISSSSVCPNSNSLKDQQFVVPAGRRRDSSEPVVAPCPITNAVAGGEPPLLEPKQVQTVQRCTSWSPSAESATRVHHHEEHRRKTTDSVPADPLEQFNDGDGTKGNTALSTELAHIFGRKQSIPCGHAAEAIPDCEHCHAMSSAAAVLAAGAVCDSPVPHHSPSPGTVRNSGSPEVPASYASVVAHATGIVHPTPLYSHTGSSTAQHKLVSHGNGEDVAMDYIVRIAREVKRASIGGHKRVHVDLTTQVSYTTDLYDSAMHVNAIVLITLV